jgi:hypothetical protein
LENEPVVSLCESDFFQNAHNRWRGFPPDGMFKLFSVYGIFWFTAPKRRSFHKHCRQEAKEEVDGKSGSQESCCNDTMVPELGILKVGYPVDNLSLIYTYFSFEFYFSIFLGVTIDYYSKKTP